MRLINPFLSTLCVLIAVSSVAAAQNSEGPFYDVEPGDTLFSIANQFGLTVQAIQDTNAITDPSILAIGQRLLLPGYDGIVGLVGTRPLLLGESIRTLPVQLANERNILVQLNRIINPAALYLGQPLIHLEPDELGTAPTGEFVIAGLKDTMIGLALRAGTSPFELKLINGWPTKRLLLAGDFVYLPGGKILENLPTPFRHISIVPERPEQGQTVVLRVMGESEGTVTGRFGEDELNFFETENQHVALFGIDAMVTPGVYPLVMSVSTADGDSAALEIRIPVSDAGYQMQSIVLPPGKAQLLLDEEARTSEDVAIKSAATGFSSYGHWDGKFQSPITSDYITTHFGLRRSYNGGPFQTLHGGVDFGAPEGTPIHAPAAGEIVLAEELLIRGNATLIDHGYGVYTAYWHQSELSVSVGQKVQSGEVIGHVGDSGLSTGPHLHWEVWVNGVRVDPLEWLGAKIP